MATSASRQHCSCGSCRKNQALYRADGGKRIADNALVAMTLLIAESRPDEKNVLTRVVVNLINRQNA